MQAKSFVNTRARFQRLRDAKLFSGWIRTLTSEKVTVALRKEGEFVPGDQFAFQAFGPATVAAFRAELETCYGMEMTLRITSQVHFQRTKEEMRLLTDGMAGLLVRDGAESDVMIVDLSEGGAAVIGAVEVAKGDKVQLYVDSSQGQVVCDAQVVYCKKTDISPNQNRIGLTLKPQNRIDTARWQRLLQMAA